MKRNGGVRVINAFGSILEIVRLCWHILWDFCRQERSSHLRVYYVSENVLGVVALSLVKESWTRRIMGSGKFLCFWIGANIRH